MNTLMQAASSWRSFLPGPVTLGRNWIYILPTKAGAFLCIQLLVMLLISINYNTTARQGIC